jgi:hypothetical protein
MKNCIVCGEVITEPRSNKRYCGNACKQKAYRDGNGKIVPIQTNGSNISSVNSDKIYTPDFVAEIVFETMEEMKTHFADYCSSYLNLFIYYKIKWNLRNGKFVELMKWYLEDNSSLLWYHRKQDYNLHSNEELTKEEQIEYVNYCAFLKLFKANCK